MEKQKSNNDEWMLLESKCNALLSDQLFVKQQEKQQQKQSPRGRKGPRRLLGRKDKKVNTKKQKQKQQQKSPSGNKESLSEVLSIVNDLRVLAAAKKGGRCAGGGDENQTVLSEPLPLPQLQQQHGGGSSGRFTRITATGGVVSREKRNGRNINNIEPPSRMLQQRGSSSRRNIRSESPMLRRGSSGRNINNSESPPQRPPLQRGNSERNLRKGGSVMSSDKCILPPRRSVSDAMASRHRFINNIKPLRTTSNQAIPPLPLSAVTSPTSSDVEVVLSPRQKYKTIGSDQSVSTLSTTSMSSFESSYDSPTSVRGSISSPFYKRSLSSGSSGSSSGSGSRRVFFARHPITEVRTRPFTPEEEIPFLFYSQADTERFREENDRRRKALSDSSVAPNVPLPKREEGYDEEAALHVSGNATSSSGGSKFDSTLSPPPKRKRVKDRKSWHALLRKGRSQSSVS